MNDYYRQLFSPVQGQFTPRSVRKNLYSVVEVQSDDEILNFKLECGITYIFLNENSDKIYIRQISERNEIVTYAYIFSKNQEDNLSDPVTKLERRMENIEKMLGGILNVQSKNSTDSVERVERGNGKQAKGMEVEGPGDISEGSLFDSGEIGGTAQGDSGKYGKREKH